MRLGYACINTQLRTPARTTRLANATPERLLELARANLTALSGILRWNREHGIDVFRVSSGIVPLASHPVNATRWWDELAPELEDAAALARGMRLSTHPGQYTLLGSPHADVTAAALADLEYHARLLNRLGTGAEAKIVIHLGGTYGDRDGAICRLCASVERLSPAARSRLAFEHDERWTLAETLAVAERVGVPVVFDAFHHELNPSLSKLSVREAMLRTATTWQPFDGAPEVHFSTQAAGKRPGAHAERLDLAAFRRFERAAGDLDVDCVLEVKEKERAVLRVTPAARRRALPGDRVGTGRGSRRSRARRDGTRGRRS